jgi:hypothetical protein
MSAIESSVSALYLNGHPALLPLAVVRVALTDLGLWGCAFLGIVPWSLCLQQLRSINWSAVFKSCFMLLFVRPSGRAAFS